MPCSENDPKQAIGIAIPSYRDGNLALDFCRSLPSMSGILNPLFVAVVSNGPKEDCFDSIDDLGRCFVARGWRFEHDHIEERGKCLAWDRAEELLGKECAGIIYLDADIVIDENAIKRIATWISDGSEPRLLAPRARVKRPRNLLVFAYGCIWARLPHVRKDVVGAGCFAVTREGRRRWKKWPTVFADDSFVRMMFSSGERRVVEDVHFNISLPERTIDLVRIRARWMQGYQLLLEQFPRIGSNEDRRWGEAIRYFMPRLHLYPAGAIFVSIWFAAKISLLLSGDSATRDWARAESTSVRQEAAN